MQLEELEQGVVEWAEQKGIFENSSPMRQMDKMAEEVEELYDEVFNRAHFDRSSPGKIKNELGDVLVTCVVQTRFHGLTLSECLEAALNKITKRTGRMVDGQFVKDN